MLEFNTESSMGFVLTTSDPCLYVVSDAKTVITPVKVSSKLVKVTEDCDTFDQGLYQLAVGSLLYLLVRTRPDIMYAVSNVAKYCVTPCWQHWTAVKRIMRCLKVH